MTADLTLKVMHSAKTMADLTLKVMHSAKTMADQTKTGSTMARKTALLIEMESN